MSEWHWIARPSPVGRGLRLCAPLLLWAAACGGPAAGPTSCDGLADKTLAITRADYSKCAGEIVSTLDALDTSVGRFVEGDAQSKDPAREASRKLAHLMSQAGFRADVLREVKDGAGRAVERWPDASMREFNALVVNAAAQLNAALAFPNQDNLKQGARLHEQARSSYSRFR